MYRSIALLLMLIAAPAAAQSSPEEALSAWATAYSAMDGSRSAAVYATDARLWGTAARTQTAGRDAILAYFNAGRQNLESRTVVIGEHAIQRFGNTAVASGHYQFRNTRIDGTSTVRPARFSMTMVNENGRWMIANHHSSLLPDAPPTNPGTAGAAR